MSAWPRTWPPKTCGLPISRLSPRNRSSSSRSSVMTLSRSSSRRFMWASMRIRRVGNAEPLLHDRARGGVLQKLPLLRVQVVLNAESRQRGLVKAAQNELLFAWIGVDVTDRENAGHAGLEALGVDLERLLLHLETPVGHRPQLGVQTVKRQHVIGGYLQSRVTVLALQHNAGELLIVAVQGHHLALDELHLARVHELAHAGDGRGRCTKFRAPVHQRERARLLTQRDRPVEGGIAAAADHEIAAVIIGGRFHAV